MSNRRGKDASHGGGASNTVAKLTRFASIAVLAAVLCGGVAWMVLRSPSPAEQTIARRGERSRVEETRETVVRQWPSGGGETLQTMTAPSRSPESKAPASSHGVEMTHKPKVKVPEVAQPAVSSRIEPENNRNRDLPQMSIAGWVFNQTGELVPGIELTASARRLLQQPQPGAPVWSASGYRTRTDNDGAFVFLELADGEYDVRTLATERYSAARAVLRAGIDSAVLVVRGEVERKVYVHGMVASIRGKPLGEVHVLPIGQRTAYATYTDETGNYGLYVAVRGDQQSYPFRFVREGYREQSLTLPETDVNGVADVRLDVRMEPIGVLATVTGTLTGPDGSAVAMATVQLFSASLKRLYKALSDSTGAFVFPGVEMAADYRLWVRPYGRYKDYIQEGLEVTETGLALPVVLEPLQGGSLSGWMVDVQGNPVPQFSLWLRSTSATVPPSLLVTGDQRGYFSVDGLPEGELSFQTQSFPYIAISGIELLPGSRQEVRLTLDWGNDKVDGYVLNANGEPVPGSQASLSWVYNGNDAISSSNRRTVADANGYFLFTQLGPGRHTLNISAPGFRSVQRDHDVRGQGGEILVQLEAISP